MPKFRKKPEVIEAMRFMYNTADIVAWAGEQNVQETTLRSLKVETPRGTVTAKTGDWIIKGVKGEFYPCKDEIFRATYDAVERVQENEVVE